VYSAQSNYQQGENPELSKTKVSDHMRRILDCGEAIKKGKRLLDVGCSSGKFLWEARLRGFIVTGVELNPRTAAIARANGLEVFVGALEQARFSPGSFDIVHLGYWIEHVPNPHALLAECCRVLSTDGALIVSTPNSDCLWSRTTLLFHEWLGIPWAALTPPHHLFLFSVKSLDRLAQRCGYRKVEQWFEGPPNFRY